MTEDQLASLMDTLEQEWIPMGTDGEQPLGYARNPGLEEPEGDLAVHDRPDGEIIGYVDPVIGFVDIETYSRRDYDRDVIARERWGMTADEAQAALDAELDLMADQLAEME